MKRSLVLLVLFFFLTACAVLPVKPAPPSVTPTPGVESPTAFSRSTESPAPPTVLSRPTESPATPTAPSPSTRSPAMSTTPSGVIEQPTISPSEFKADLTLRYHWQSGSVAPPYHYEYDIRVGPTTDADINFSPDYEGQDTPVWTVKFAVSGEQLSNLRTMVDAQQIMTKQWRPAKSPQIGGSTEYVEVTVGAKTVSLPSQLERADAVIVSDLYTAMRALVPKKIWDDLMARRQAYMNAELGK